MAPPHVLALDSGGVLTDKSSVKYDGKEIYKQTQWGAYATVQLFMAVHGAKNLHVVSRVNKAKPNHWVVQHAKALGISVEQVHLVQRRVDKQGVSAEISATHVIDDNSDALYALAVGAWRSLERAVLFGGQSYRNQGRYDDWLRERMVCTSKWTDASAAASAAAKDTPSDDLFSPTTPLPDYSPMTPPRTDNKSKVVEKSTAVSAGEQSSAAPAEKESVETPPAAAAAPAAPAATAEDFPAAAAQAAPSTADARAAASADETRAPAPSTEVVKLNNAGDRPVLPSKAKPAVAAKRGGASTAKKTAGNAKAAPRSDSSSYEYYSSSDDDEPMVVLLPGKKSDRRHSESGQPPVAKKPKDASTTTEANPQKRQRPDASAGDRRSAVSADRRGSKRPADSPRISLKPNPATEKETSREKSRRHSDAALTHNTKQEAAPLSRAEFREAVSEMKVFVQEQVAAAAGGA
ncbi:unnamed protein product, partial [Symbiodinium sp. CCMP2456]